MKYLLRATLALVSAVSAAGAQTLPPLNFVRTLSPKSATTSLAAAVSLPEADRITSTTYYNGLGWEVQTVATWAGPGNKDQVTLIGYDAQGRPTTQYLPYAVSNTGGNTLNYRSAAWAFEQGAFYTTPPAGVPQSTHPFSVSVLEASPLGRVLQQGAPGTTWQPGSGRTVRMGYHVNVTSEVRAWSVNASTGATSTTEAYLPGTLFITQTRDENGNYTREYKNRGDRVILRRVQLGSDSTSVDYWAETYYIYDDFGRLRCVIQPQGVAQLRPTGWPASVTLTQTFLDTWCFQYRYDGFGRTIEQRVPGGGWVHTVYNSADLPILTQDANQRAKSPPEWSFVKYDHLRRPILSGLMRTTSTRTTLQTQADAATVLFEAVGTSTANGGYTWAAYPTLTDTTILSVTFYDHYDFDRNGTPDVAFTPQRAYPAPAWPNTQGQQTGSRMRVLGSTTFLRSWQFADERGRTIFAYSSHHLGGGDTLRTAYNFVGWPLKTRRYHRATGKPDLVLADSMIYDHVGRVTETYHRINSTPYQQTAAFTYNELGQLIEKRLHRVSGTTYREAVAQAYNIRGWLSAITSSRYTQSMRYDTGLDPQYNGNIAGITYQNQNDISREYRYRYDKLSRLLSARNPNGLYDERGISYDRNGNILSLSRTDNGTRLDSLAYTYSGNRLLKVNDRVSTASPNHFPANTANHGLTSHYTYDANGNLTADVNKGITSITYNHLNKPVRITLSSGSWIEYRYDAAGTKVSKTTNTANKTDYLGGIEYDANALKRISFREGYAELLPNATYEYKYAIKDHLGNTRSLFAGDATTLQRNHYYAFGLSISSLDFSGAGAAWKYQYNGKEKQTDFGLNWLDYGARQYDPVVARWHSVDPKAYKFTSYSTYHYGYLNPIRVIDIEGEENVVVVGVQDKGWAPKSDQTSLAKHAEGRRHFLEAGFAAAVDLKKNHTDGDEQTTLVVMRGDYSEKELSEYRKRAEENGIGFNVVESGQEASEYINKKAGEGDSRTSDQITDFHYYGHGGPEALMIGGLSGDELRAADFTRGAFARNAQVKLYGCNNGTGDESIAQHIADRLQGDKPNVKAADGDMWWGDKNKKVNKNDDPKNNNLPFPYEKNCIGCVGPVDGARMKNFKPPKFD